MVQLEWIKAHKETPGNNKVDQLAKDAANRDTGSDPQAFVAIGTIQREEAKLTAQKTKQAWENENPTRKGKNYIGRPETTRLWLNPDNQRKEQVWLSRMRTGHINCGSYMFNIGKRPTPECQCGAAKQDVQHILTKCPLGTQTR